MARTSNPLVVLRTLTALVLVGGAPWMAGCDDGTDDSADGADDSGQDGADDGGTGDDLTQCERNPQGDVYAVGLTKEGELIKVAFVDANPAPPAKGLNAWDVMITDLEDNPLSGLDLSVSPFMPAHQHGSPTAVVISAGEMDGEYLLDDVDLFMAGLWEVTISAEMDESTTDSVAFSFCIDP